MIAPARAFAEQGRLNRIIPVLLLFAAFALRVWQFGNPLIQSDEQFYLLVGQRMWEGAWVYSDIWDRKSVGLFLLYALFAKLGGGVYAYQIAATLFAAATAWAIACIARRWTSDRAAACAGLLYLAALNLIGGDGGQSPVFYNLPMVLAACCVLRVLEERDLRRGILLGALAMLCAGIALQIKYTAVFEGVFFGLVLMAWLWQRGAKVPMVLGVAAGWAGIALVPTVVLLAVYAASGRGDDFIYANFVSFFARGDVGIARQLGRLAHIMLILSPVLAAAMAGTVMTWRRAAGISPAARFCALWLCAAVAGLFLVGDFYDHYALPVLVPAAIGAAALFDAAGRLRWLAYAAVAYAIVAGAWHIAGNRKLYGTGDELAPFVAAVGQKPTGCLYVYQGPSSLYSLTRSCLLTRYTYPSHLSHVKERNALGVSQVDELKRLMAQSPRFVLIAAQAGESNDPDSRAVVMAELHQGYSPAVSAMIGKERFILYRKK